MLCEHCQQRLDAKTFHLTTCPALIEETALADIAAEPMMRQFPAYVDSIYTRERNAEMHAEWPASAEFHKAVAKEIKRLKAGGEVRCRRCQEVALEQQVAGEESPAIAGVTGRHEIAHTFALWLEKNGLAPSRETVVDRDPSKRHYRICWASPSREMGGEVQLFSGGWIRVTWEGLSEHMPHKGHRVFESDFTAQMFLELAVIDQNWADAQRVPVKQEKGSS